MRTYARPIDVIVSFGYNELTPLRFEVKRKDGSETVANVDRVIERKFEKIAGVQTVLFICEAAGKRCELKFWKEDYKWVLLKA